jgi:L-ascorbate 6-phosphate lactonase
MNLAEAIRTARIREGELALFWVGQAGFILKDSNDRKLAIDLYLTDCGERLKGFKRISPKILSPTESDPDYYLITHSHFDHLDYDAVPVIASCGKTVFCGPASVVEKLRREHIREEQCIIMRPGDIVLFDGIKVTAVSADHGLLAPDALGYLVEMGGHSIYFSGDTAYRPEYNLSVSELKPDIAVVCINGQFGNMDALEGAKTAIEVGARLAIPCHFWTFAEHEGNPKIFIEYLETQGGVCRPRCMCHGEMLVV